MSTSDAPMHRLQVHTVDPALQVSVIDNSDHVHASEFGRSFEVTLPPGIYTLRSERDGRIVDKVVRLVEDQSIMPRELETYSPVLLPTAATTHEYYTYRAWEISQNPTAPDIDFNGDPTSSLMLFVRAVDMSSKPFAFLADNLVLQSLDGLLSDLGRADSEYDSEHGFTAWHARMSPGLVFLEDRGKIQRQTPIRLVPGFQTQVYVMCASGRKGVGDQELPARPMLEDMRVLNVPFEDLDQRSSRDPYDRDEDFAQTYEQVDAGLVALNNQGIDIGDQLVNTFLNSKFRNPLLGLIGAYLMLFRVRAGRSSGDRENLARIVIDNLSNLLPGSADIEALKILAEPLLGEVQLHAIRDIPLFHAGTQAILERAATDSELVPEGSLLDVVSDILIEDSVWTSWEPIPMPLPDEWARRMQDEMSWVEMAIAEAIDECPEVLDASHLARQIGVTKHAVKDAYCNLVQRAQEKPTTLESEGLDLKRMKRGLLHRVDAELVALLEPNLQVIGTDTKISFQQVYPKLKNLMSKFSDDEERIVLASDPVEMVVRDWQEPAVQQDLLKKIERSFAVNLGDFTTSLGGQTTVRDIASLVVKKSGL